MSFCVGRAKPGAVARKIVRACLLWCGVAATADTCAWGQTAIDGAAEMGEIKATEGAVPVRAVALTSIELAAGNLQIVGIGVRPAAVKLARNALFRRNVSSDEQLHLRRGET